MYDAFFKRVLDVALAAIGLVLFAPVMVATAVLVRIDSPGPVFYRGLRAGLHGIPFRMWKFRTMHQELCGTGGLSTGKDDARVTRVGRVIRRWKIDELPQLLNVMKGDMSIVGPRPEFSEFTNEYTPEEQLILNVRPGVTDYASLEFFQLDQVLGAEDPDRAYDEVVKPVKNRLRLKYAKEHGLRVDLLIILRTVVKCLIPKWTRSAYLPATLKSRR